MDNNLVGISNDKLQLDHGLPNPLMRPLQPEEKYLLEILWEYMVWTSKSADGRGWPFWFYVEKMFRRKYPRGPEAKEVLASLPSVPRAAQPQPVAPYSLVWYQTQATQQPNPSDPVGLTIAGLAQLGSANGISADVANELVRVIRSLAQYEEDLEPEPHVVPTSTVNLQNDLERFHRPAALGIALVRALSSASDVPSWSPLDGDSSEGADATVPRPPSFASELAALWVQRATSWLVEEWKVERTEVPDVEVLDVWNCIVSLDGLKHLQSVTAEALVSGALTLTRLVSRFVFPQKLLGDHRALPTHIVLAINKLVDTVPLDLLEALPFETLEESVRHGDPAKTASLRRAAVGLEELAQWRANRGEEIRQRAQPNPTLDL